MLVYAWKSLGWFLAFVAVALGFLLVPLQVAAERKKLDKTVSQIADAHRDIRALETEFDTRANLAQLEKWNGDTLRLIAPAAAQFVPDTGALASMDVQGGSTQMASLVVPSLPDGAVKSAAPAISAPATAAVAAVRVADAEPSVAGAVAQVRDRAIASGKAQAVALLDRKLMSDSTIGDLLSGTRAEAGVRH